MKESDLLRKIGQYTQASRILHIQEGIKTGLGRGYENSQDIFILNEAQKEKWGIEEGAIKPIIKAEDIAPFRYKRRKQWVIYSKNAGFKEKFPNAMTYLRTHKRVLERRGAVWIFDKQWWEVEDPLNEERFKKTKIITPLITRRNSFALDQEGNYILDDCVLLCPKVINAVETHLNGRQETTSSHDETSKLEKLLEMEGLLYYLLGLFNSQVSEWYFQHQVKRISYRKGTKGKFYWFRPKYIGKCPIPFPTREEQEKVITLVKNLVNIGRTIQSTTERKKFEGLKSNLNEVIFEVFDLEEKEKGILQASLFG
ncbi:MAG: hypothetical protein GWO20_19235 [Candidatus Korarchaeota archaeon]|nr:hypothetical protein [Candidatus Korarchaeota archaeon]NIU85388.1 hypothetical protein [Candidatus Thorarchaeota archaeon]NIW15486.1 hypothetical protein [Candidatus Thorarchaeota archaeon]NIW53430.1 hypothetical protein [Candidatus Korarchaeota archaeon]